jgi:hypothetical protein
MRSDTRMKRGPRAERVTRPWALSRLGTTWLALIVVTPGPRSRAYRMAIAAMSPAAWNNSVPWLGMEGSGPGKDLSLPAFPSGMPIGLSAKRSGNPLTDRLAQEARLDLARIRGVAVPGLDSLRS